METALFGFQVAEILDSIWSVWCVILLVAGVAIWSHATFFMEDDNEDR